MIEEARKTKGQHEVLLPVGRDGVHVPMRGCWKEAGCATLALYDRRYSDGLGLESLPEHNRHPNGDKSVET